MACLLLLALLILAVLHGLLAIPFLVLPGLILQVLPSLHAHATCNELPVCIPACSHSGRAFNSRTSCTQIHDDKQACIISQAFCMHIWPRPMPSMPVQKPYCPPASLHYCCKHADGAMGSKHRSKHAHTHGHAQALMAPWPSCPHGFLQAATPLISSS